jgi:hypothetical protein
MRSSLGRRSYGCQPAFPADSARSWLYRRPRPPRLAIPPSIKHSCPEFFLRRRTQRNRRFAASRADVFAISPKRRQISAPSDASPTSVPKGLWTGLTENRHEHKRGLRGSNDCSTGYCLVNVVAQRAADSPGGGKYQGRTWRFSFRVGGRGSLLQCFAEELK